MKHKEFRKLHVDLPRQPVVNQRPWLIVGLLLVFIILLIAACNYYVYTKRSVLPERQGKTAAINVNSGIRYVTFSEDARVKETHACTLL
jgi:hypothetical protein